MPFRLLGFATDPDMASNLCGGTFARYAAAGAEVTLVCADAYDRGASDLVPFARKLGAGNLIVLDYQSSELTAAGLEAVFADVMRSVRPHVVVAEGSNAAVSDAATSAFTSVRRTGGAAPRRCQPSCISGRLRPRGPCR